MLFHQIAQVLFASLFVAAVLRNILEGVQGWIGQSVQLQVKV